MRTDWSWSTSLSANETTKHGVYDRQIAQMAGWSGATLSLYGIKLIFTSLVYILLFNIVIGADTEKHMRVCSNTIQSFCL